MHIARRDLLDGRTLFVITQIYNWKLTVGYGETTYDDGF